MVFPVLTEYHGYMNYGVYWAIRKIGLDKKKWFVFFTSAIAIFIAIYKYILPKLDYQKYENILVFVPLIFIFFLIGFIIYSVNTKEGKNKSKALLRAILWPLGVIFLIVLAFLFGIYIAPLLV